MSRTALLLAPLLVLAAPQLLFARDDWTRSRCTVRFSDEAAERPVRVERAGAADPTRKVVVWLPVEGTRELPFLLERAPDGSWRGRTHQGAVGVLAGGSVKWSLRFAPPREREAAGQLTRSGGSARPLVLRWEPLPPEAVASTTAAPAHGLVGTAAQRLAAAGLSDAVPSALRLVPGVGASEAELRANLVREAPGELTLVYWNVGKGEHAHHARPARVGDEEVNALAGNVRVLAALEPDFLVLAEVSKPHAGRPGTLDPTTEAILAAALPGRLLVPSIWEFPLDNNNAIFSRRALLHVGGEERTLGQGGSPATRSWSVPPGAGPSEETALVRTQWLDWTPPELAGDPARAAEYRAKWGGAQSWNTRAHTRIDLVLRGQPVSVFPVHFAMPWLLVEKTAERGGFLVCGLQHHQLYRRGPLEHQAARAHALYRQVPHDRVVILGDFNVPRFPKPNFPPLRLDPDAPGDGSPERQESLAFALLRRGFFDAFEGDRAAFSWPSPAGSDARVQLLPRQLIDHVLHGGGFEVVYRSVFFPRGADHGALAVKLELHPGGRPPRPHPPSPLPAPADADPPRVELLAPAPGATLDARVVRVEGRVFDASPLTLAVAGVPVTPDASGAFAATIPLAPGFGLFDVTAEDAHGNRATRWRSVVGGRLRPADQPVADAVVLRLGPGAFEEAARWASARLAAADLEAALQAKNPLFSRRFERLGLAFDIEVRAERLALARPPRLTLAPAAHGLAVRADVDALTLELTASAAVTLGPMRRTGLRVPLRLSAQAATVSALATARVAGGVARTELEDTAVELRGFSLDFAGLPDFARAWVSAQAARLLRERLAPWALAKVPPALDQVLADAQRRRHGAQLLGREVSASFMLEDVRLDRDGATLRLAAAVGVTGPGGALPLPAGPSGSLHTPGPVPSGPAGADVAISLDDDLLNRVAYAAWRAGALDLRGGPALAAALGAPAWADRVDGAFAAALLGQDAADLPPGTPLELTVRPGAAPVIALAAPDRWTVGLGELEVVLAAAPPGGPARELLRVTAHATLPWQARVGPSGLLEVRLAGRPELRADAEESALDPNRRRGVAALLELTLPEALEALTRRWPALPIPTPSAVEVRGLTLGVEGDDATARGAVRAR